MRRLVCCNVRLLVMRLYRQIRLLIDIGHGGEEYYVAEAKGDWIKERAGRREVAENASGVRCKRIDILGIASK